MSLDQETAAPAKLPKYFKDEAGFCYAATPALAELKGMTAHDGEVDEQGFAVEGKPAKKSAQAAA